MNDLNKLYTSVEHSFKKHTKLEGDIITFTIEIDEHVVVNRYEIDGSPNYDYESVGGTLVGTILIEDDVVKYDYYYEHDLPFDIETSLNSYVNKLQDYIDAE